MSSDQNSIYSQGFNFASFVQEGVDARTGQYTSSIALYESPAKARNCVPFHLSLNFSPLNVEDVGFGTGWSLNLSQYQHIAPRSLFTSTGEHYQITETGGDLRVEDQKLQSFKFQQKDSNFEIIHKDGGIEILSNAHNVYNTSVPVALYAANGRSLTLTWTAYKGQPRLSTIQEGEEILLRINYRDPHVEIVHSPGTTETATFTIVRQNDRLAEFWMPLEDNPKWKFTYETYGTITCISNVRTPTGLQEKILYKAQGHKLPSGGPYEYIPYAIEHTVDPGNQPTIRTLYSYSSNNFLGYGTVDKWKYNEDNLYRVTDTYQYTSTVSIDGGQKTTNTYNKFHLIVKTQQELDGKQITQSITYYAQPNTALANQPAQFQLPKSVQTTYSDSTALPESTRDELTQHRFDEWGNPTMDIQTDGVQTDRVYYPPAGEEGRCPADPHGFQRYLKEETITPPKKPDTAPVRSTRHTYGDIPTATGAPVTSFVLAQQSQAFQGNQPVSSIDRTYVNKPDERNHGRLEQQMTKLFDKYPLVQSWSYQYPDTIRMTQIEQLQSFDKLQVTEQTGFSMNRKLFTTHIDEAGIQSQFEYDQIGRQVSVTVSPGTSYASSRKHQYAPVDGAAGYILTVTDVKGVKTRYTTDGLQRVCQIEKQDDDGKWDANGSYTGTFRVVHQRNYNALGQCSQTIDIDWLRVTGKDEPKKQTSTHDYQYDGWGHVSKVTDSNGVVTSALADPISQTYTEGIKDQGNMRTKYEAQDVLTQTALLKSDGTLYSTIDYSNDGLGRKAQEKDSLGAITRYSYDWFDRVNQTTFPDSRISKTQYADHSTAALPKSVQIQNITLGEQSADGLDRVKSQKVGSRTTLLTYDGISPKPSDVTTPKKGQAHMTYDASLDYALTAITTSDNPQSYEYDHTTADTLKGKNSYYTEGMTYLPSGRLASESIHLGQSTTLSTKYTYSMNGKLQLYSDVHGQNQVLEYDNYGRIQQLTQGLLTVTLGYDSASSRLSQSSVLDTQKRLALITNITYDDFGREVGRTITQGSTLLYTLIQSFDTGSRVTNRELKDGDEGLLRQEKFQYDNMDRLIDYQCQGSQIPVDKGGRQLKQQQYSFNSLGILNRILTKFQDGSTNTASYTYSDTDPGQLIRITNTHPNEPGTIDLDYDANGYLIRDEKGRVLEYDTMGCLETVLDSEQEVLSQYHYDSRGRLVCQAVPNKPDYYLHYRADSLVAVTHGNTQISYISDGQEYWGQILKETGRDAITQLWASDAHKSILAWLDTDQSPQLHTQSYTPYGFCATTPAVGWNGQWRDPVTGWYHLGNGYRVYNPVLMCFHSPDAWSPFVSGEINPYAYCLGDPINRLDPSGHFSIFGWQITWRNFAQAIVGLALSVLAGIFTDGASLAIQVGADIATGAVAGVTTGAAYDAAVSNKGPTWESAGSDFLFSAIGSVVGQGVSVGAKQVAQSFRETLGQLLEGAEKLRNAGGKPPIFPRELMPMVSVERLEGRLKQFELFRRNNRFTPQSYARYMREVEELRATIRDIRQRESTRWTWDDTRVGSSYKNLRETQINKYREFRFQVKQRFYSPMEAADLIGDSKYTKFGSTSSNQYEIRLGGKDRVTFTLDTTRRKITILQVGGHT
ncbi:hypothetical protein MGN70_010160 [Eutypa lata]|nr:hypothetical protein MGN70_010160 [Eutypa lata]